MIRAIFVPLLLGALGLSLAYPPGLRAQAQSDAPPFILVNGTGQVRVAPDRARLSFAVVTEAATAAEAASSNAARMEAVIGALRATGVAGLTVESWGYDLLPRYARTTPAEPEPRIVGYQATNNVRATVDDVNAVGRLIDAGVGAGANRVASLQFEARDTETARAEALRRAVQNARVQAEAIAGALGVALGPPLEVQGGAQSPFPRPMTFERVQAMEMAMMDTPIEPAEQVVSAQVSIRYRLGNP